MRATIPMLISLAVLSPSWSQAEPGKTHKAAPRKDAQKTASPEEAQKAFERFCQDWMEKLAAREHDNVAHIKWSAKPDVVEGEYVGYYTQEHTCVVKDGGTAPVGKIAYQEVRYEKRGRTIEEAQQSPPHALETTAVTEIFRYDKGAWLY